MASRVAGVVKRHPQITFFVLAYAVAWAFVPFGSFGAFGPLVAALVVVPLTQGRAGLRKLGSRLVRWRVHWFWYLVALGLPLTVHLVTAGLNTAAGADGWSVSAASVSAAVLTFLVRLVNPTDGPLGEEPGWRGFALPGLQSRYSPLAATTILALLVAGWHLPLFFLEEGGLQPPVLVGGLVTTFAVTHWYAWLFNRTAGSVLLVLMAHSIEGSLQAQGWIYMSVWCAAAVGLIVCDRKAWRRPVDPRVVTSPEAQYQPRGTMMTLPLLAAPGRPHNRGTRTRHGCLRALAILLGATCLVVSPSFVMRASASPDPDLASIDAYIEKEMREVRIPGLALGIVHNEEVVHLRGFGEADPDGRTVTPQTPFILASASKSFTALAIMQLVESGRVDLDAPVRRYLPAFRVADEAASAQITLRHLLHHTSGLPEDSAFPLLVSNDIRDEALSDRMRALQEVQLNHGVGEVFEYTDANYDVLGLVVQTVSGQSYESYITEQVFAPLGMRHSYTNQSDARRNGLATGHRSWFGYPRPFEAPYSRAAMPSSYLISSAEDLTHFLSMQLNGGRYQGRSVVSPEGIAAMHQPAIRQGTRDIFYGMGWESRSVSGVPVVRHDGTNANFYADMALNIRDRWGVVILTNFDSLNLNGGRLQGLSSGVISLLLGEAPPQVPMPHHPLLASATLLVAAVTVVMLLGILRTIVLLRRWRTRPETRPRGPWATALRVGLPFVANLGWGLGLLLVFPQIAYPLMPTMLIVPDLGYLVVASGLVALSWGILRTVLVCFALRRRPTSRTAQFSVPATAEAPVGR